MLDLEILNSYWEAAVPHRELSSVLCGTERDGVGRGREVHEAGTYVYTWLSHLGVQQRPTQHLKAITPQLNIYMHTPSE